MAEDIKLNADATGYVKGFEKAAKSTEELRNSQLGLIKTSTTFDENNRATSKVIRELASNGDVLVTKFDAVTNKSGQATGRLKQYAQVVETSTAATRKLAKEAEAAEKALLSKNVSPSEIKALSIGERIEKSQSLSGLDDFYDKQVAKIDKQNKILDKLRKAPKRDTSSLNSLGLGGGSTKNAIAEEKRLAKVQLLNLKNAEQNKRIQQENIARVVAREQEEKKVLAVQKAQEASLQKQNELLKIVNRAPRVDASKDLESIGLGQTATAKAAVAEQQRLSKVQEANLRNSKEVNRVQQENLARVASKEQAERKVLAVQEAQIIALQKQDKLLATVRRTPRGDVATDTTSLGLGQSLTQKLAAQEEARLERVNKFNQRNAKQVARAQQGSIARTVAQQQEEKRLGNLRSQSIKAFRSEILKTTKNVKSLNTEAKAVTKQFELFGLTGKDITRSFAFSAVFQSLYEVRQQLTDSISLTLQWEKAIAEVTTITSVTAEQIRQITKANSEAFGASRLDQTEAAYQAFSNQVVASRQELEFFSRAANELSTTSLASNEQSVNAISSVIKAYSRDVTDAREISATLFKTVELGRLRIGDLANTIGTVAVPAAQLGVEFEELQALLATTTVQGIKYNNAQTLIRGVLTKLIKPTKELSDLLESWGFNSGQAAVETLGLAEIFARLEQEGRTSAGELGNLFSRVRAVTGAMIIASEEGGKLYAQNLAKIRQEAENVQQELRTGQRDISSYSRALEKITETKEFRLRQQLEEFKSATADAGEEILKAVDALGLLENGAETALLAVKSVSIGLTVLVGAKLVAAFKAAKISALGFGAALNTIPGAILVTAASAAVLALGKLAVSLADINSPMQDLIEESNKLDKALLDIRTSANLSQKNLEKLSVAFNKTIGRETAKQVSKLGKEIKATEDIIKRLKPNAERSFSALTSAVSSAVSSVKSDIDELKSAIDTGLDTSSDLEFSLKLDTTVAEAQFEAYKRAIAGTDLSSSLTIEQNIEKVKALISNLQSLGDSSSEKEIVNLQQTLNKLSVAKFLSEGAGLEAQLDLIAKKQADLAKVSARASTTEGLLEAQKKESAALQERIRLQKELSTLRINESKRRLLDIEKTLTTEKLGDAERAKLQKDRLKEGRRLASLNKKAAEENQRLQTLTVTQAFKQQDQRKDLLKLEEAKFKSLKDQELELLDTRKRLEDEIAKGRKASAQILAKETKLLLAQLEAIGVDTSKADAALQQVANVSKLSRDQATSDQITERAERAKSASESVAGGGEILNTRLQELGEDIRKNTTELNNFAKKLLDNPLAFSGQLPTQIGISGLFSSDGAFAPITSLPEDLASELKEALAAIRDAPSLESTRSEIKEASSVALEIRSSLQDQLSSGLLSKDNAEAIQGAVDSLGALPSTLFTLLQNTQEQGQISSSRENLPSTGQEFVARIAPTVARLEKLSEEGLKSDEVKVEISQEISGISEPKVFADEVVKAIQEGIRTGKYNLGR